MNQGKLGDTPHVERPNLLPVNTDLQNVVKTIASNDCGVWIVGGAVRDALLGINPHEYDIASDATPDQIESFFPGQTIPTGKQFGTITVRSGDSMFEVTTLRTESGYGDGRRPDEVEWGRSLAIDLSRRDFTINAMAYDLARGLLHDPYNGEDDLKNSQLRAVGNANQRLSEDGLRIMRAYRFMDRAAAGVWIPNSELNNALIDCRAMLYKVSVERIWSELKQIITGKNADIVLAKMANDGVLNSIFQTTIPLESIEIIASNSLDLEPRLAILLKDETTMSVKSILTRLRASSAQIKRTRHLHFLLDKAPTKLDSRLYRAVISSEVPTHIELAKLLNLDYENHSNSLQYPTDVKCIIDGRWLMERTNLGPGKKLGRLKEWIHRIQIERNLSTVEQLETILCSLPWQSGDPNDWPKVEWP